VYEQIADGGRETRCERWTTRYCLAEFTFTEAAREWLLDACKTLRQEDADEEHEEPAAKKQKVEEADYQKKPCYLTIDGMQLDSAILDACQTAIVGQGVGRLSLQNSNMVFNKFANGDKVTQCDRWTVRYCLTEFKWTPPAAAWMVDAMLTAEHDQVTNKLHQRHSMAQAKSLKQHVLKTPTPACFDDSHSHIQLSVKIHGNDVLAVDSDRMEMVGEVKARVTEAYGQEPSSVQVFNVHGEQVPDDQLVRDLVTADLTIVFADDLGSWIQSQGQVAPRAIVEEELIDARDVQSFAVLMA
jgi:hypothetical protein